MMKWLEVYFSLMIIPLAFVKETTSPNRRLIEVRPEYGRDSRISGTIYIDSEPGHDMGIETTPRGDGVTDDIIFSGAGSGCGYDDEDDCSSVGSGDNNALVRPIVDIKTTPRPPTTTAKVAVRTTTQMPGPRPIPGHAGSGEPPCGADDEDCMGSGSGDGGVDPVHTPKVVTDDIYITSPEPTRKYPDPWGVEERPHGRSTQNPMVVTVNMTTVTPRRPSVVTTRRTFHASDTPTERPRDLTKEESGGASDTGGMLPPSSSKGKSFNLSSNIIVIVGITAGVLIILLLLAFAIYKYKSRDEGSYKIDESKNYPYQEGAAVAACNKPSSQVNGGSCTRSSHSGMQTASKPKKNVKEWYV